MDWVTKIMMMRRRKKETAWRAWAMVRNFERRRAGGRKLGDGADGV